MNLLERDSLIDRLSDLLGKAAEGDGRLVVIRGEAGIGKTSLVRAFLDLADDQAHVLRGGCDDLLTARPLGPLWDMTLDEPSLRQVLEEGDRGEIFGAVLALLTRSLRPTLLIVEDIHWADDATLDLVKFLGRRIDRTYGLVLVTFRDEESSAQQPLRLTLGDIPQGSVERLSLDPLSVAAVAELVGDDRANELWRATSGNPFLVAEALSSPSDTVPRSILDAVGSRVLRLSGDGRSVLELCSVVPTKTELALLGEVFGEPSAGIEEAIAAGLLEVSGDAVSFRHELARRAVEEELSDIRRRKLNSDVLQALDVLGADLSRKAHHARAAGDVEAMIELLPAAARRASELKSHSEAYGHLRALEPYVAQLSRDGMADYFDQLADEEYSLAEGSQGIESGEKAIEIRREIGDAKTLSKSLISASRYYWVSQRRDMALEAAHEAAAMIEAGEEQIAMAFTTLSQLAMLANQEQPALEYAEKALNLAGEGPSRVKAHALNNIGAVRSMNRYPEGLVELEESFELSRALGLAEDQTRAAVNIVWAALSFHDLGTADLWLERGIAVTEGAELVNFETYLETEKAMVLEKRGRWAESLIAADAVLAEDALAATRVATSIVRSRILVRQGHPDALSALSDAWERAAQSNELQRMGPAAIAAAEFRALGGETRTPSDSDLLNVLDRAVELGAIPQLSELGHRLVLAGLIDELPGEAADPYPELAAGDWKAAVKYWDDHEMPYERAEALADGDNAARIEAIGIFDRLGALPMASRLRKQLKESGVTGIPRRPSNPSPESTRGLTARQTEVLELLSRNLTNTQIADQLFLSSRTVDHHVAAILSKLGANNRAQAVEKARTASLIAKD